MGRKKPEATELKQSIQLLIKEGKRSKIPQN